MDSHKKKLSQVKARFLKNIEEINRAATLLHNVYVDEMKWKFGKDTPLRIRINTLSSGNKILLDDCCYTAKWIGAFCDERLVGCLRILHRIGKEQLLETQHYQKNNKKLNKILNNERQLIETNRGAVHKDYRGSGIVILKMFEIVFSCAYTKQLSVFLATAEPSLIYLFRKLGFYTIPGVNFKYEEQDPRPVFTFFSSFEKHDVETILNNIQHYLKLEFEC